jgi:hypothetical protein
MSKAMTEDPYESLGNAIILQAVKDYRATLRRIKHNPKNRMAIDEALLIEKFFRGQLYAAITNIDSEFLIDKLRKEVA